MYNPFKNSNTNKRYYTWDYYLKQKFGFKTGRVSLNAKFSCPNIDGKVGKGGCTFCLQGSSESFEPLEEQYLKQLEMIQRKWKTKKHFTYFQAYSNTYGDVNKLRDTYEPFIGREDSVGLIIGTRPDCLDKEILGYLEDVSKRTTLWVELGLQSSNDKTSEVINRCHDFKCFVDGVKELRKRNINVAVHIINSLPGETKKDMIKTIKDIANLDIQAIKIHMLSIMEGTQMANNIHPLLTLDEYVDIVCEQLQLIDENIVIQRLTGDPIKENLIEPQWVQDKINVLNSIDKKLESKNIWQGKLVNKQLSKTVMECHRFIDSVSSKKKIAVDATLGNGFDTLFMAPRFEHVYSFDIQEVAIKRSKKKIEGYGNVTLNLKSHENITDVIKEFDLVVYNTGFLPGTNKKVVTNSSTTIKSLENALSGLRKSGYIILTIYKGHDDQQEYKEIMNWLKENKIYHKEKIVEDIDHAPSIITIKNKSL